MLRKHIESDDLQFSHAKLRKGFKAFLEYTIRLADAFQFVNNGKQYVSDSDTNHPALNNNGKSGSAGSLTKTNGAPNPRKE